MSVTSNWEWENRSRILDVNIDQDGVRTTRNNWTMIRSRISNAPISSQLGEETGVLTASSGGVALSEYIGQNNYIQFGTGQNWTDTTYKYYANYNYFQTGSTGAKQYYFELDIDSFLNKPDSSKTTVVRPRFRFDEAAHAWKWWWEAGEWGITDDWAPANTKAAVNYTIGGGSYPQLITTITVLETATPQQWTVHAYSLAQSTLVGSVYGVYGLIPRGSSVTVPDEITIVTNTGTYTQPSSTYFFVSEVENTTTPTNYIKTAESSAGSGIAPTDPPSVDGKSFATAEGTFSGSSTATDAGLAQPSVFYCSADEAVHSNGVDWYKQTQTWIYKDEYA